MTEHDPHGTDPHAPGAKLDAGKIMAGILGDFSRALSAVAEVGTHGAAKYTREGWCSVPNGVERYTDAKWRHLLAGHREAHDPDSGFLHAAHEAWNALAVLELMLRGDDSCCSDSPAPALAESGTAESGTAEYWRETARRVQDEVQEMRRK